MYNKLGKLKHTIKIMSVFVIMLSLLTVGPIHYLSAGNSNPVGEAEGVLVTTSTAIAVGATAVVSGYGGYKISQYFDSAEAGIANNLNGTTENSSNESVRVATHSQVITSGGISDGFFDNVDNDLNTLEGSVEQKINQRFVKVFADENASNITSEAQAVQEGEQATTTVLKNGTDNIVETVNFNSYSVKISYETLRDAGYPDDVGAGEVKNIDSFYPYTADNGTIKDKVVVKLNQDISADGGSSSGEIWNIEDGDIIVNLNGHDFNYTGGTNGLFWIDCGNITFKNGGNVDLAIRNYDSSCTPNINLDNVDTVTDNGFAEGSADIYAPDTNTSSLSSNFNVVDNRTELSNLGSAITFNATKIANSNDAYANASEVPQADFFSDEKNKSVGSVAKTISVDSTYYGDSQLKIIVPYVANDTGVYKPLGDDETVIVKTPTNGLANYAEPLDYPRMVSLINTRDDLSSQVYPRAQNYSADLWNDWLSKKLANNETVVGEDGINPELGSLQFSPPTTPEGVRGSYAGIYESTTRPVEDIISVENTTNSSQNFTGTIYSTDMNALLNQTNNSTYVEEGDVFNTSVTNKTFIVEKNTGKTIDIEGEYEVTLIEGKDRVKKRTFDRESTNLSKRAEQLQEQKRVIEKTIIKEQPVQLPDLGGNQGILILVGVLGLFVILRE